MENKKCIERLSILKDAMIKNYLTEIDFDDEEKITDAYENLLYKTIVDGAFDDIFLSDNLDDLDKDERQRIMNLARKYNSLCFYNGQFDNWIDSIEGVYLLDLNLTSIKLLDNYDYLIKLARDGGEDVLRFLYKFQTSGILGDNAVISKLRSTFYSDDILEEILLNMSKEDGIYKDFTDTQKLVLCNYPNGVLYKAKEDESFEMNDVKLLKMKIQKMFIGSYDFDISEIDTDSFEYIISRIYTDYNKDTYISYKR